jgi:hypothetical protein
MWAFFKWGLIAVGLWFIHRWLYMKFSPVHKTVKRMTRMDHMDAHWSDEFREIENLSPVATTPRHISPNTPSGTGSTDDVGWRVWDLEEVYNPALLTPRVGSVESIRLFSWKEAIRRKGRVYVSRSRNHRPRTRRTRQVSPSR